MTANPEGFLISGARLMKTPGPIGPMTANEPEAPSGSGEASSCGGPTNVCARGFIAKRAMRAEAAELDLTGTHPCSKPSSRGG